MEAAEQGEAVAGGLGGGAEARPGAAGAVGAVRSRGEAEHEDAGRRVPEAGQRPPPVVPIGEPRALLARAPLAPLHQPRAAPADRHLGLEGGQLRRPCGHAPPSGAITPSIRRSITGSSSRTSAGTPRRTWREASSATAPTTAKASSGEASRASVPARA